MAAYKYGMKKVIIPAANVPDLAEVDPVVKDTAASTWSISPPTEVQARPLVRPTWSPRWSSSSLYFLGPP